MALRDEILDCSTDLITEILKLYPTWIGNKQFKGTPGRIARMYQELCWPEDKIKLELDKQFKSFENGYREMMVEKDISVWTLCPHHLLPCHFTVAIGYIPTKGVLGLSKLTRISVISGKRPIMQEQYTTEIAELLMSKLGPKGVAVYVVGKHGCMSARGVQQNSEVVTAVLKGDFLKEGPTREEFYRICKG